MLHVSALFEPSSGIHFKNYCFPILSYSFWAIALGIPFALQIIIIVCMVLGAHCCSYSGVGVFFVGKSSGCSCLRLWKGLVSLRFLCGCLSPGSAVGQGLRPFVAYPPSCRGGRFYMSLHLDRIRSNKSHWISFVITYIIDLQSTTKSQQIRFIETEWTLCEQM